MSNDNFTFSDPLVMPAAGAAGSATDAPGPSPAASASCAAACPLAQIPAAVWKDVLRRPFRKRHPFVFWGLVLLTLAALAGLPLAVSGGKGLMGGARMALVSVTGPIMDVAPTLRWIRTVSLDPDVKGVLVRVDSPGGGAAASQEIYEALRSLAQKKPVAVSMGSMAASGGLMVSMAGKRVFANASTVTGSIGVRMDIPQVQGLLGKLGVTQETLTTAPYKDAGSYLRPLTPEQRAYFKNVLDDMHRQFVDIIAEGRHMEQARASALADGKIFTGREALRLGLVDALGGQADALRWLSEQCGVPADRKLLTRPEEDGWLPRGLKTLLHLDLEAGLDALAGGARPVFLFQL
ncbi:signal peptide peptidase SppA [uncultured Desulfovibrio sp.]|uniref:signal peptide peptidase SppA n=1 Tax=uncultured Desulfovibrio sp. TaxID=167968 RepID=UPI00262946C4|nr:signal peptide peptidase SppA [uncultured Desulfovibrio sp.]